ncbi:sulfatase [soil metagenome]
MRFISICLLLITINLAPAKSPNVIVIFCDDLGYGDLGCYGAKGWATPNLDQLARDGMKFTDFYVSQPVCSASRASLLTGCYANRLSIHGALSPSSKVYLNENETTLANLFKSKGYVTGMAGKWHLGHQSLPLKHGFDTWLGLPYSNDMWPFHPTAKAGTYPPLPLYKDNEAIITNVDAAAQETLTRRYTERAIEFIDASKGRPFFFYLAYSMPHVPLHTEAAFKGKSKAGLYGDVIQELDHSVGQILKTLKDRKLDDNTLILFTSDNGPWLPYGDHGGSTGGLREGKGTVWEGGVREPCIVKWPGVVPAGSVCAEPCMTIDVLPTLAKILDAKLPKLPIDGKDIGPLWRGEANAKSPHEAFAFYYRQNEMQAVRSGPWKLILPHSYPSMAGRESGKDGKPAAAVTRTVKDPELYNLEKDRNETTNVAAMNPDVIKAIMIHVEAFRADLGDSATKRVGTGVRAPGRE